MGRNRHCARGKRSYEATLKRAAAKAEHQVKKEILKEEKVKEEIGASARAFLQAEAALICPVDFYETEAQEGQEGEQRSSTAPPKVEKIEQNDGKEPIDESLFQSRWRRAFRPWRPNFRRRLVPSLCLGRSCSSRSNRSGVYRDS